MSIMRLVPVLLGVAFVLGCDGPGPLSPVSGDQLSLNKGGVPSDGNGNKAVFEFDINTPVTCSSGEVINRNDFGWAQYRVFGPPNNRNVLLGIFHDVITYTNADGDTFVWRDVGADRYYIDDGHLFVSITGRSTASGNINRDEIVVGHCVLNLTTGEVVFLAGNEFGNLDDLACDALT